MKISLAHTVWDVNIILYGFQRMDGKLLWTIERCVQLENEMDSGY